MSVCEGCQINDATTTYLDKALRRWKLCEDCRKTAKRRKA